MKRRKKWLIVITICLIVGGCSLVSPEKLSETRQSSPMETQAKESQNSSSDIKEDPSVEKELWSAYIESWQVGSQSPMITENSYCWEADLDGDGQKEEILFDWGYFTESTGGILAVVDAEKEVLYSYELGSSHVGWDTFYLYQEPSGKEYLLRYHPNVLTGIGDYEYELLTLTPKESSTQTTVSVSSMKVADQGHVSFYVGPGEDIHKMYPEWEMDIPAMVDFAGTLNGYIENSYLLVSTDYDYLGVEWPSGSGEDLFVLGTPEERIQIFETYAVLLGSDTVTSDVNNISETEEKLITWCDTVGIPYKK